MTTTDIINVVLDEFMKRADLVDLYSLADPSQCSKYIVVASDALDKLFASQMLYPSLGKGGIISFQSVAGIQRAMPADLRQKQKDLCLRLSFFFIRVFQIFGSLSLSVLDGTIPEANLPDEIPKRLDARRGVPQFITPGVSGYGPPPAQARGWFGRGGALDRAAFHIRGAEYEPYATLLNRYLTIPYDATDRPETHLPFKSYTGILMVPQGSLYTIVPAVAPAVGVVRALKPIAGADPTTLFKPVLIYVYEDETTSTKKELIAQLVLEQEGPTRYKATLIDFSTTGAALAKQPTNIEARLEAPAYSPTDPQGISPKEVVGKSFPDTLIALMSMARVQLFGAPPFRLHKFLKQLGYADQIDSRYKIQGTNLYVPQPLPAETTETRINYKNEFKLKDGEKIKADITATLRITETKDSVDRITKYGVHVDFKNTPTVQKVEYNIDVKEKKDLTFKTSIDKPSNPAQIVNERGEKIHEYLERVFREIAEGHAEDEYGYVRGGVKYDSKGRPIPFTSTEIPEGLEVKELWTALAQTPPIKAHCAARALQLLSAQGIRGTMTEGQYSEVCRTKFLFQKDGSLPKPGETIASEMGILALANLFVDVIKDGAPAMISTEPYKKTLEALRRAFERLKPDTVVPPETTVRDIKEMPPKKIPFCDADRDTRILLKSQMVSQLQRVTKQMIQIQAVHTGKVMQIFMKLFDPAALKQRKFKLNDAVIRGGFDALNKISEEARGLLLNYYSSCEAKYTEGLGILYSQHTRDEAAGIPEAARGLRQQFMNSGAPAAAARPAGAAANNNANAAAAHP